VVTEVLFKVLELAALLRLILVRVVRAAVAAAVVDAVA